MIYTVAASRSGTGYMARLYRQNLSDATVYHQRFAFDAFGAVTPELSHLMTFNTLGNAPYVRDFWLRKLNWDIARSKDLFVETSHLGCQGGLLENIQHAAKQAQIHVVFLQRDFTATAWSLLNRFDLANPAAQWLLTLDPNYANLLVPLGQLGRWGLQGQVLWYLMEMRCRAEYYRLLLQDSPDITVHHVRFEEILTEGGARKLLLESAGFDGQVQLPAMSDQSRPSVFAESHHAALLDLVDRVRFDAESRASRLFAAGRRLADPLAGKTQDQLDDLSRSVSVSN